MILDKHSILGTLKLLINRHNAIIKSLKEQNNLDEDQEAKLAQSLSALELYSGLTKNYQI